MVKLFADDTTLLNLEFRISINKRLYSIDRLFYLSHRVRLQFYKSFILPYCDYCMSLSIYFPKGTLQTFTLKFLIISIPQVDQKCHWSKTAIKNGLRMTLNC